MKMDKIYREWPSDSGGGGQSPAARRECEHIYGFDEGFGGCSCDGDDYDRYCPLCGIELKPKENDE